MLGTAALQDLLNALTDHLLTRLPARRGCDHTLRLTRAWLREHCPEQEPGFLAFFGQQEHACDCRVLAAALAVPDPFLAKAESVPVSALERSTAPSGARRAVRSRSGERSMAAGSRGSPGPQLTPARHAPDARRPRIRSGAPLWHTDV
jgi:Protein of unknown function (DUF2695)